MLSRQVGTNKGFAYPEKKTHEPKEVKAFETQCKSRYTGLCLLLRFCACEGSQRCLNL